MKFLATLRQLGLVRYRTQAGTSSHNRPADFLLDEVFYADKDLAIRGYGSPVVEEVEPSGGRKALFWVIVALAALAGLILSAAGGVTIWLLAGLWLWTGILYLEYQFVYGGRFSYGGILALLLFGLLASVFLLGATVLV